MLLGAAWQQFDGTSQTCGHVRPLTRTPAGNADTCWPHVGAAIAAVYAPFGGAMFENISLPLVPPALAASLIATATSRLVPPDRPTYTVPSYPVTLDQILCAGIMD